MTELEQMRAENLQLLQKLVEIDSICECEGMPAQRHCWKMAEIATEKPSPEQTARLAKRMELLEELLNVCNNSVGKWLSAAVDDPGSCIQFKNDISKLFIVMDRIDALDRVGK